MLGGTQYDRTFAAYERSMKANNNFGMTDKQQIADQYGRQAVAIQQRQIKAENKAFGRALAKEKATLARQAQQAATAQTATTANLPAVVKNGKIQLPKISELLSGQGTTQSFTGISQNLPAVVQNGQVVTPNLPAVVRNGQIVTPNLPAVVRNGQIITPNFDTPAQTFAGIKPEYLSTQAASVEMPAEPVSLVGKTKKQIQKEQKKLWKAEQKKNGTKQPTNLPATTGSTQTNGTKPVAAGTTPTNGATTPTATNATPANGAKPVATGAAQNAGATQNPAGGTKPTSGAKPTSGTGAKPGTANTPAPVNNGNVPAPAPKPNPAGTTVTTVDLEPVPNPTPNPKPNPSTTKKPGFFKKLGSKIKGVFKKITKTKAGKAGLIAAGIGLLAAGGAWLYNKLKGDDKDTTPVNDDKKTVPPKSGDDNNGGKVGGKDGEDGNGGKVDGKDNGEDNGKANGHGGTHKVVKGETIHKIVTDALKEQGIDEPTDEQIKKAKRALLEENADAVQTYHGKKKEWHGNKFFFPDEELTIPDYKKLLEETEEEQAA